MPVSVDPTVPVFPIDVELYDRIVASGALEGLRVELVDGVFVEMSPEYEEHRWAQIRLAQHVIRALPDDFVAAQSGGVQSGRLSVPEPDLYVMTFADAAPASPPRIARSTGVLFVAEVSLSSRSWDLGRKRRLYAAADVPEYWVVDLVHRRLVVHTEPAAGDYSTVRTYAPGQAVAPAGIPVPPFDVATALPPSAG